jgi:hypothetical protein
MDIDSIFFNQNFVVHLFNNHPPIDHFTLDLFLSIQLFHENDLALLQIRAKSNWENVLEFQSYSF